MEVPDSELRLRTKMEKAHFDLVEYLFCMKLNEIQNLLSSEKRTLDHWETLQFFFFLAQVRRLWRQL